MPTLPNRLRTAAQYTGLDSMRELLIEAAGALEGVEPVAWLESEPSTRNWQARDLFFGPRSFAYSSRMHFGEKPNVMPNGNRLTPLYTAKQPQKIKDHEIAKLVNELRDVAIEFHGAQQLRERIASIILPIFKD